MARSTTLCGTEAGGRELNRAVMAQPRSAGAWAGLVVRRHCLCNFVLCGAVATSPPCIPSPGQRHGSS